LQYLDTISTHILPPENFKSKIYSPEKPSTAAKYSKIYGISRNLHRVMEKLNEYISHH
jgi:hypothetical protein